MKKLVNFLSQVRTFQIIFYVFSWMYMYELATINQNMVFTVCENFIFILSMISAILVTKANKSAVVKEISRRNIFSGMTSLLWIAGFIAILCDKGQDICATYSIYVLGIGLMLAALFPKQRILC